MDGACRTYGERRGTCRVWWGNLRESDLGINERIILISIFKKWDEGMSYIDLTQDRDKRRLCGCGNERPGSIKCWEFTN
jgi:hypothetical protein